MSGEAAGAPIGDVADAARRFLHAIAWNEHMTVWEMLSPTGRDHVLVAGERRGLDPLQAQRLRLGTSPMAERHDFLSGLVHGLRVDFSLVPLEDVRPTDQVRQRDDGTVEVPLECPASFAAEGWAAGSLIFSRVEGGWRVDRVNPVVSGGG